MGTNTGENFHSQLLLLWKSLFSTARMGALQSLPCALCQHIVNPSQGHGDDGMPRIKINSMGYPTMSYQSRPFLVHRRCFELINDLSSTNFRLLIDLVEPTFPQESLHDQSAFVSHGPSLQPCTSLELSEYLAKLPPEIWRIIFQYDVGRLLFVLTAASQIRRYKEVFDSIPTRRLTQRIVVLESNIVRIHVVNIGGRTYISGLSEAPGVTSGGTMSSNCHVVSNEYLAVKSDGIGLVDIAFSAANNRPVWALNTLSAWQTKYEFSIVKGADIRRVRIISDVCHFPPPRRGFFLSIVRTSPGLNMPRR